MLFRLLGVLEVRTREGWSGIGAAKWRALLAVLLLRHDQVVSTERLVDELWGDDAPPGLVRLSCGIEDTDDLLRDIVSALDGLT